MPYRPAQNAFRARGDTVALNTNTFDYNLNANWSQMVDTEFRVRFLIQEVGGVSGSGDAFKLRCNLNGSGYQDVTTTSTICKLVASAQYADHDATTAGLLGGSGNFINGEGIEGVTATNSITLTLSNRTELEFSLQINSADVANGDAIILRVYRGTSTQMYQYNQNPTITVVELQVGTYTATGGATAGGTAGTVRTTARDVSGGATAGGTSPSARARAQTATGGATAGGTATSETSTGGGSGSVTIATTGSTHSYSTSFPTVENPISEGSKWLNGLADGLDWKNVRVTANGAQPAASSTNYDDPIALLKTSVATFDSDQMASAVVYRNSPTGLPEIELRLRSTLGANSCTGYEFLWGTPATDPYVQIVRWNGDSNDYTVLSSIYSNAFALSDGDVIEARAIGSLLLQYINDQLVNWAVDTTYTSGQPGIGFYGDDMNNIGLKSVTFSDDVPQVGGASSRGSTTTALDFAFPGSVAEGAMVVVGVADYERTPPATGVTKQAGTCTIDSFTRDVSRAGSAGVVGLAWYSARVTGAGTLTVRYSPGGSDYCGLGCAALAGVKASDRVGVTDTNTGTGTTHTTNSLSNTAGSALLYVASEAATSLQARVFSDVPIMSDWNASTGFVFGAQVKLATGTPNTLTDTFNESVAWWTAAVEYLAAASSGQSQEYTATGGATAGGTASSARVRATTTAGGGAAGGTAPELRITARGVSGGATAGGTAPSARARASVASGGATAGGTAAEVRITARATSNGATAGGTATKERITARASAGGATAGGTAGVQTYVEGGTQTQEYTATGGATAGGLANDTKVRITSRISAGVVSGMPFVVGGIGGEVGGTGVLGGEGSGAIAGGAALVEIVQIAQVIYNATGGATAGGVAEPVRITARLSDGGATAGGAANVETYFEGGTQTGTYTATGGATAGGTAALVRVRPYTATGGATAGGAADVWAHPATLEYTATGGATAGGTAAVTAYIVGTTLPGLRWATPATAKIAAGAMATISPNGHRATAIIAGGTAARYMPGEGDPVAAGRASGGGSTRET